MNEVERTIARAPSRRLAAAIIPPALVTVAGLGVIFLGPRLIGAIEVAGSPALIDPTTTGSVAMPGSAAVPGYGIGAGPPRHVEGDGRSGYGIER